MRVIATEMGFFAGYRRRSGAEFDIPEGTVLPKWVVPATPQARVDLADAPRRQRQKDIDALVASAGPKRAGTTAVREVNTGLANAVGVSDPPKVPQVKYPEFEATSVPTAPARTVEMVPATDPSLF